MIGISPGYVFAQTSNPEDVDYLRAVAADAKVTLYWTEVKTATSYKIYRGTQSVVQEGQQYNLSTITTGNVTQYEITGLTNGTTYYFALTAINGEGQESLHYSYEVRAQPTLSPGIPPDFESPSAVGDKEHRIKIYANDKSIQLVWPASTDNVGIAHYKIYMGTQSVVQEGQTYNLPEITTENSGVPYKCALRSPTLLTSAP